MEANKKPSLGTIKLEKSSENCPGLQHLFL